MRFGDLLKQLRRRVGLTQGELARRVGYSVSLISRLEKGERLPSVTTIDAQFVDALDLHDEPHLVRQLIELAAQSRGERPPVSAAGTGGLQSHTVGPLSEAPGHVPAPLFALVGREREVEVVCQRVLAAPGRLLTLLGPPGVGKTQLSLAVAARLRPLFRDGVWFVPLAAVDDAVLVAPVVAAAMGLVSAGAKPALERLVEGLRRRQTLLVLDNVEQVTSCAPLLVNLLQECPNLRILATSTKPLRLRSEQRHPTPPLTPAAAVELFIQRAQGVDPDFVVTPACADDIINLCQRLDYLPLAIELIAARIDVLTPARLLARLDEERLDLLADGPHDLEPHHRTLRVALQRSYDLLTPAEQGLFRSLGVYAGGFDRTSVLACGLDASLLPGLVAKGLLHSAANNVGQRFYLLETLRAFAVEVLTAAYEESTMRRRHADYFLALAMKANTHWRTPEQQHWLRQLDSEHDNLRTAMRWLIDHDGNGAQQLGAALLDFWFVRGQFTEARRLLDQALLAGDSQPSTHGHALLAAAGLAHAQDDNAAAMLLFEACLPLLRVADDLAGYAEALRTGGWIAHSAGQPERARTLFTEALEMSLELGDESLIADVHISLAQLYALDGDEANFLTARQYFAEGVRIARQIGRQPSVAYALHGQASLEFMAGRYPDAMRLAQEALLTFRSLDFRRSVPLVLLLIGEVALLLGDLPAAHANGQAALDFYGELDAPWGIAAAQQLIGHVALGCDQMPAAEARFKTSLEIARRLCDDKLTATALAGLGAVALVQGEPVRSGLLLAAAHRLLKTLPRFLAPGYCAALDSRVAALRIALGDVEYAAVWAEGWALSLDQAVAVAISDQAYCRSTCRATTSL